MDFANNILIRLCTYIIFFGIIYHNNIGHWVSAGRLGKDKGLTTAAKARSHDTRRNVSLLTSHNSKDRRLNRIGLTTKEEEYIPTVGAIFTQNAGSEKDAFDFMMQTSRMKFDKTYGLYKVFADIINTADIFKLSRLVCFQFLHEATIIVGGMDSYTALRSLMEKLQTPFLLPYLPYETGQIKSNCTFSITPAYHKAILEVMRHLGWKDVIYIYDSPDGFHQLQMLTQESIKGQYEFVLQFVQQASNADEVINIIHKIEALNRETTKHIILFCKTDMAKKVLIKHVQDKTLGRQNYHYFMTGLVMDDIEDKSAMELGAINVTGFQIVDPSNKNVKDFMKYYSKPKLSAPAALMVDTLKVVNYLVGNIKNSSSSFQRKTEKPPENIDECFLRFPEYKSEVGNRMTEIMKGQTMIDGLTGLVRFSKEGTRENFTLQVVQMNVIGDLVKIGTWYDYKGFKPLYDHLTKGKDLILMDSPKESLTAVTILEKPYMMQDYLSPGFCNTEEPPILIGLCMDIAHRAIPKIDRIIPAKDKKYGALNINTDSGWDGLIGELLDGNADIILVPLRITAQRQKSVAFSKPFITFKYNKPQPQKWSFTPIFTLLSPTKQVWVCIVCGVLSSGLIFYLIKQIESRQLRINNDHSFEAGNQFTPLRQRVSCWGAVWVSIMIFFRQNRNIHKPTSWAERIVVFVLGIFSLAALAVYFTNVFSMFMDNFYGDSTNGSLFTACPMDRGESAPFEGEDGDHPSLSFVPESNGDLFDKGCLVVPQEDASGDMRYAFAVRKDSHLRQKINLGLEEMRETGELQSLIEFWFNKIKPPSQCFEITTVTWSLMSGPLYILAFGLLIATMVAVGDLILQYIKKWRANRMLGSPVDANEINREIPLELMVQALDSIQPDEYPIHNQQVNVEEHQGHRSYVSEDGSGPSTIRRHRRSNFEISQL